MRTTNPFASRFSCQKENLIISKGCFPFPLGGSQKELAIINILSNFVYVVHTSLVTTKQQIDQQVTLLGLCLRRDWNQLICQSIRVKHLNSKWEQGPVLTTKKDPLLDDDSIPILYPIFTILFHIQSPTNLGISSCCGHLPRCFLFNRNRGVHLPKCLRQVSLSCSFGSFLPQSFGCSQADLGEAMLFSGWYVYTHRLYIEKS